MKNIIILLFVLLSIGLSAQQAASLKSVTGTEGSTLPTESAFSDALCSIVGNLVAENDPNQVNGTFSDDACASCGTGFQQLAAPFTPAADVTIGQICWVGGFFQGCTPATFPDFRITFYDDAAGFPGNIISGPHTVSAVNIDSGTDLFGSDEIVSSADFPSLSLTGGDQVWVSIITTSAGGCSWFWEQSNTGNMSVFSIDPAGPWIGNSSNFSFFIGEQVEIVPTLGQWAVICLGLLMAIFGTVSVVQRQTVIA